MLGQPAINHRNWGYDTGQNNRVEKLIIRFSNKTQMDLDKDGRWHSLSRPDTSRAGKEWSEKELDIQGRDTNELAVVIGELVPKGMGWNQKLSKKTEYTEGSGYVIHVPYTGVIVHKLDDTTNTLYLLRNKKDGLCAIAPLPEKEIDPRIVFYIEWTGGITTHDVGRRKAFWMKNNIGKFCKEKLQELNAGGAGE